MPAGLQIQSVCTLWTGRFDSYTPPPQKVMATECYLPVDVRMVSKAGWLLRENGIEVRVVSSPPEVDPECGFSLVFPCERLEEVTKLLDGSGIVHKKVRRVES